MFCNGINMRESPASATNGECVTLLASRMIRAYQKYIEHYRPNRAECVEVGRGGVWEGGATSR